MKKTFGEIIRECRENEGLPLRKVAAFVDIDPSTLSKIERGERSANKEMIPALAEILKISYINILQKIRLTKILKLLKKLYIKATLKN